MPTSPLITQLKGDLKLAPKTKTTVPLNGPYLTMSAAYAAGFRGWPLVIMTAIAGWQSSYTNAAPHVDTNGIDSTGLWQINSANTAGLTDPVQNAQAAFSRAGGNTLSGLSAWALTPPGQQSLAGATQPNPYPWGTVPPPIYGGYTDTSGVFHPLNYSLPAANIAQALEAYLMLQTYGPATQAELNAQKGWGSVSTTGAPSGTVNPNTPIPGGSSAADTSTSGGCASAKPVFDIDLKVTSLKLTACNAKAIKGAFCVVTGGGIMLFGVALIVVSGLVGKGPLSPVVDVAGGYIAGARKLPGVRRVPTPSGPSESQVRRSDQRVISRETKKTEKSYGMFEGPNPSGPVTKEEQGMAPGGTRRRKAA